MASIIARDLGMQFQQRQLFSGANLHFAEGDCIYLMGDNGSGKTTLMKILAGLQTPSSGSVSAEGFATKKLWQKNTLNGCAVYLHQHPYLYDGTVKDNLKLALELAPADSAGSAIAEALELAKLGHLAKSQASHLSGGERQRLAIARAWLLKPRLLMLDEPVSNMDKESRELVLAMTARLKADGTGLLIASHQHGQLTALCTSRWLIQDGRIATNLDIRFTPSQETHYVLAN
ncbi:energy-coupling factor ABC transporter ATP-binding protein [Shewanella sp. JM162201]|uniref:Energy-coupling factor ABC transporter ATP-binding protein n=1 Tax=Shewanella jiangmenensis TaxID=2837387 RepID=A0ABS5VAR3_9GAMM|nr:energy-coupling factor ABC transporter ATP-binding protein [Shewanella jiangmenensis]MBT1446128.1 energy-coupling factor ABC transporter ATP-binding protein [Shewanella jiangmenensis]